MVVLMRFFIRWVTPAGRIKEAVAGTTKVRFIDIPVSDTFLQNYPYYAKSVIPIRLYPGAENDQDIHTLG